MFVIFQENRKYRFKQEQSVFSTLCPHRVEKTESSNNRAQIVYNQTHQCLTEKGMNY